MISICFLWRHTARDMISGAVFWKNRERYREQINDLFRWTAIAVKDEDDLKIEGC